MIIYRIVCSNTTIYKIAFLNIPFIILVLELVGRKISWSCRSTDAYVGQSSIQTREVFHQHEVRIFS